MSASQYGRWQGNDGANQRQMVLIFHGNKRVNLGACSLSPATQCCREPVCSGHPEQTNLRRSLSPLIAPCTSADHCLLFRLSSSGKSLRAICCQVHFCPRHLVRVVGGISKSNSTPHRNDLITVQFSGWQQSRFCFQIGATCS